VFEKSIFSSTLYHLVQVLLLTPDILLIVAPTLVANDFTSILHYWLSLVRTIAQSPSLLFLLALLLGSGLLNLGLACASLPTALIAPAHPWYGDPPVYPRQLPPRSCRAGSYVLRLPCPTIRVRVPLRFLLP
jgi:hypothetical protein